MIRFWEKMECIVANHLFASLLINEEDCKLF